MILDVNSISGAVMTDPHTVRVGVRGQLALGRIRVGRACERLFCALRSPERPAVNRQGDQSNRVVPESSNPVSQGFPGLLFLKWGLLKEQRVNMCMAELLTRFQRQ